MTLLEAVTLYKSAGFSKLCNTADLNFSVLFRLSKLSAQLSEASKFYANKLQELAIECSDKNPDGKPITEVRDGQEFVSIKDPERMHKFIAKKKELESVESDIIIEPIQLTAAQVDSLKLTVVEFIDLESIISVSISDCEVNTHE